MRKKRGPDFDPIWFEYTALTLEQFGRKVPTVVAKAITEEREGAIRKRKREEENRVLFELKNNPEGSFSDWASCCGFISSTDKPLKSKVFRVLERLKEVKLVGHDRRRGWHLTQLGVIEAQRIN